MNKRGRLLHTFPDWNSVTFGMFMLILLFFFFVQSVRLALVSFFQWDNLILGFIGTLLVFLTILYLPGVVKNIFTASMKLYEYGIQHHNSLGKKQGFFIKYIIMPKYFHHFKDMDSINLTSGETDEKTSLIITNQYGIHSIAIGERAEEIYEKLKPAFDQYKEREAILTK
ncbi:MAG: hypothetical protein JSW00_05895 [Thermoplasmata archaeon]|nr:MAG: hypothetical protein JSW00_05895 [Thermoplasmata archaeon]